LHEARLRRTVQELTTRLVAFTTLFRSIGIANSLCEASSL